MVIMLDYLIRQDSAGDLQSRAIRPSHCGVWGKSNELVD